MVTLAVNKQNFLLFTSHTCGDYSDSNDEVKMKSVRKKESSLFVSLMYNLCFMIKDSFVFNSVLKDYCRCCM